MTTDLTKIKGIGANSAKDLSEAGFDTIDAVAGSTPEALGEVSGFGPKRAERVIASAKELIEDVEPTPVVEPAVIVATQNNNAAASQRPRTFLASAAVLVLFIAAIVYFGFQTGAVDSATMKTAKQDTTGVDTEQGAGTGGQESMNGYGNTGTSSMAEQRRLASGQGSMNGYERTGASSMAGQRTVASGEDSMNGAAKTGAASMPAMGTRPSEPEWVSNQRAQAEKRREESWNRFVSSLPPAEAEQVTRQRAMAMERREEAKKRQAAIIEQHNAYINQRFGG